MSFERKTIFLYPKCDQSDVKKFRQTSRLITQIKKIVRISNKGIEKILYGGCFASLRCKPTVSMEGIGQALETFSDYSNVRICVAKYNGIDYTSSYQAILSDETKKNSDISHLVALYISSRASSKIKFLPDKSGNFDAIVETDLEHLEQLLVAIMFDISLYHFFALKNEINFRKDFNTLKFNYITKEFGHDEIKRVYGEEIDSSYPLYLPFSLRFVQELTRKSNLDSINSLIKKLIKEYCSFLISSLSKVGNVSEKGYLSNLHDFDEKYRKTLEEYVEKCRNNSFASNEKNILFISANQQKNDILVVLKYALDEEPENVDFSDWIRMLNTNLDIEYDIVSLERDC